MKSGSSDTELGIGILVVTVAVSCNLKGISLTPGIVWAILVLAGIPIFDKIVLASTFSSPFQRWAIKVVLFLIITGICLML